MTERNRVIKQRYLTKCIVLSFPVQFVGLQQEITIITITFLFLHLQHILMFSVCQQMEKLEVFLQIRKNTIHTTMGIFISLFWIVMMKTVHQVRRWYSG